MAGTVLVVADLHWDDRERNSYRHQFVDTIVDTVKYKKVDTLLILGDLCDEKDHHGSQLVNAVVGHIVRLAGWCRVIILCGNHDYVAQSEPFFAFLGRFPKVTWVGKPTVFHVFSDRESLLLPHTRDHVRDWINFDIRSYASIFTHNTFKGSVSDGGVELDGIPPSVFSKRQMVISGDVHIPQAVGGIVEYVGAPYPIDWTSGPLTNRHMILINNGTISYIPYKGPRKIVLDLTLGDEFTFDDLYEGGGVRKGDMLKIRVSLEPSEFKTFHVYKDMLMKKLDGFGCTVTMVQPVVEAGGPMAVGRKMHKRSDIEVVKAYASATGIKETTVKTGLRLLEKV